MIFFFASFPIRCWRWRPTFFPWTQQGCLPRIVVINSLSDSTSIARHTFSFFLPLVGVTLIVVHHLESRRRRKERKKKKQHSRLFSFHRRVAGTWATIFSIISVHSREGFGLSRLLLILQYFIIMGFLLMMGARHKRKCVITIKSGEKRKTITKTNLSVNIDKGGNNKKSFRVPIWR